MFKIVNSEHLSERYFVLSEHCSIFASDKQASKQSDANKKEAANLIAAHISTMAKIAILFVKSTKN